MEESTNPVKKNRHNRSFSTMAGYSNNYQEHLPGGDHLGQSSCFREAELIAATVEQSMKHDLDSYPRQSPVASSSSKGVITISNNDKTRTSTSSKLQRTGWNIAEHWSRMAEGIRRRKATGFERMRSVHEFHQTAASEAKYSRGQSYSFEENSETEETEPVSQDGISHSALNYAYASSRHVSQDNDSTSLSRKYQPKRFSDILGHEIIVGVISNAVQKKKIEHLYLFHGPSGTGKTSMARVFAIALHCESISLNKPCWSCKGCSRSLYTIELCSGSRTSGFRRISTILQSASFTQAVPGFKVFIIEESHLLNAEAWDELVGILETTCNTTLVFVLIAADAKMIPEYISSRCQKFWFPKLRSVDITFKLSRIIIQEEIRIDKDALKLIVSKAEGSLREAEYVLDQLTLLGARINSSMVEQFVGLVPKAKLVNLLEAGLGGDTESVVIITKELIALGIEAQAIILQLASLITDKISANTESERLCHALKTLIEAEKQHRSSPDHFTWMYGALLQITSQSASNAMSRGIALPETTLSSSGNETLSLAGSCVDHHSVNRTLEQNKMERSNSNTTCGSDRDIANEKVEKRLLSLRGRGKEAEREFNLGGVKDMEEIWLNILEKMHDRDMKEFLCNHVKLASLTVSSANAIVHLTFKSAEDKLAAQRCEESISKALRNAIGCPVAVNMSLHPVDMEIMEECIPSSANKHQIAEYGLSRQQQQKPSLPGLGRNANPEATVRQQSRKKSNANADGRSDNNSGAGLSGLKGKTMMSHRRDQSLTEEKVIATASTHEMLRFSRILNQEKQQETHSGSRKSSAERNENAVEVSQVTRTEKPKHRWLSLSSILQSDASIEPYSQDILFDNANSEKEGRAQKSHKPPIKGPHMDHEEHHLQQASKQNIIRPLLELQRDAVSEEVQVKKSAASNDSQLCTTTSVSLEPKAGIRRA